MDAAKQEAMDNMLLAFAQQCGGIQEILHHFFAFMARRTDFYYIQDENNKNTGFPEGVAEKMLIRTFRHYQELASQKFEEMKHQHPALQPPQVAQKAPQGSSKAKPDPKPPDNEAEPGPTSKDIEEAPAPIDYHIEGDPEKAKVSSSTYNGAVTENYTWSQTLQETTVEIPMPKGTRGKDLDVAITKNSLRVGLRNAAPVIDGKLPELVREDDSMYVMESGVVQVILVKTRETWWKNVVEGGPEIDTQKVDSVRNIHEYDDETQAGIRKIMFDQDQKRKGLPTSDEMNNEDMLRKAWDAEGSPFKGQPFDPSVLNMSGQMPPGMPM